MNSQKHILLTGMPGVGKTTLIKKINELLSSKKIKCSGFYTEELRDNSNKRIGFDVVSLDGKREKLARIMCTDINIKYKLGQYAVFPNEFENFAIPVITNADGTVVILDEIGKMELFSERFKIFVENLFRKCPCLIIATIPVPGRGKPIPLVESLRNNPKCKIYNVDRSNRNTLLEEIIKDIKL